MGILSMLWPVNASALWLEKFGADFTSPWRSGEVGMHGRIDLHAPILILKSVQLAAWPNGRASDFG